MPRKGAQPARPARSAEAAFQRGETGVDGVATEEAKDQTELERGKAREQLLRGRTWLGRELLTWLLWRSESRGAIANDVEVLFSGRLTLRGIRGEVTELTAKGELAPYAVQVRRALDEGLLVHQARLRLTRGEKSYEATLDAEFLDVKSAKLPELLTEAEDDRVAERLDLADELSGMIDALVQAFLVERTGKGWKKTVGAMKRWMRGEG